MSQSAVQEWLPYLSQILTATVAVIAILVNRRSSKDTLAGQLNQRIWERRTEIYLEMIRQTDVVDPHNLMTPEGLRDAAIKTKEQKVPLLPIDPSSEEWRDFEARIEAFASPEVRFLYWLWDSAVAAWTWAISTAVSHHQHNDEEKYQEWQERVRQTYNITFFAREELVTQIRAELRFETRQPGVISFKQEPLLGYLTDLDVGRGRYEIRPTRSTRVIDIAIDKHGNLDQTIRLGQKTGKYPDADSNAGPTA